MVFVVVGCLDLLVVSIFSDESNLMSRTNRNIPTNKQIKKKAPKFGISYGSIQSKDLNPNNCLNGVIFVFVVAVDSRLETEYLDIIATITITAIQSQQSQSSQYNRNHRNHRNIIAIIAIITIRPTQAAFALYIEPKGRIP